MLQKSKAYVHGTAAEKLQYDVYEENKVLKTKKQQRNNTKAKFKLVLCTMLFFSMVFLLIYRYAIITDLNYSISESAKEYNNLKSVNTRLSVEIEKATDIQKIREEAELKFGMHKPDRHQVVKIAVPREDYTEVSPQYEHELEGKKSAVFALVERLGKFTRLLY